MPPIDREALGAWLAEYHRQEEALGERQHRAFAAIAERVGHDARKLADDLDVTAGLRSDLERDRLFMLVAAHVPGLAPALRLIYEHVLDISYGDEAGCCSEIAHLPSWIA